MKPSCTVYWNFSVFLTLFCITLSFFLTTLKHRCWKAVLETLLAFICYSVIILGWQLGWQSFLLGWQLSPRVIPVNPPLVPMILNKEQVCEINQWKYAKHWCPDPRLCFCVYCHGLLFWSSLFPVLHSPHVSLLLCSFVCCHGPHPSPYQFPSELISSLVLLSIYSPACH